LNILHKLKNIFFNSKIEILNIFLFKNNNIGFSFQKATATMFPVYTSLIRRPGQFAASAPADGVQLSRWYDDKEDSTIVYTIITGSSAVDLAMKVRMHCEAIESHYDMLTTDATLFMSYNELQRRRMALETRKVLSSGK